MNVHSSNDQLNLLERTYSDGDELSNQSTEPKRNSKEFEVVNSEAAKDSTLTSADEIEKSLPSRQLKLDHKSRSDPSQLKKMNSIGIVDNQKLSKKKSHRLVEDMPGQTFQNESSKCPDTSETEFQEDIDDDPITILQLRRSCLYLKTKMEIYHGCDFKNTKNLSSYMPMQHLRDICNESQHSLKRLISSVFETHVSRIEAKYGFGQSLYFDFLRFLFFLNLVMMAICFSFLILPTLLARYAKIHSMEHQTSYFAMMKNSRIPLELIVSKDTSITVCISNSTGTTKSTKTMASFPEDSFVSKLINISFVDPPFDRYFMLYGSFSPRVLASPIGEYHIAFAYIFSWIFCNIISLILIIIYYEPGKNHTGKICTKTLTMWKFSVIKKGDVERKTTEFARILKTCIEDLRLEEIERRNKSDYKLHATRMTVWGFVIGIYIVCCLLIYFVSYASKELDFLPNFQSYQMLKKRSSVIMASILSLVFAVVFSQITKLEKYSPTNTLSVYILRVFVLNILEIGTIFVNVYKASPECELCWEDDLAKEMWFTLNFILLRPTLKSIFYILYGRIRQTTGDFGLPDNLLDLVVSQMTVWLGMFFMPMISIVAMFYFGLLFFIQQAALYSRVQYCSVAYNSDKLYRNVMMCLQFSYLVALVFVGYGLVRMRSSCCGPFGKEFCQEGLAPYSIMNAALSNLPQIALVFIRIMESPPFVYVALVTLCLICFYYRSNYKMAKTETQILNNRLNMAHVDQTFLLKQVKKLQEAAEEMNKKLSSCDSSMGSSNSPIKGSSFRNFDRSTKFGLNWIEKNRNFI